MYLDHAATTTLRPEARDAMEPFLGDVYGNPSGMHRNARAAKNAVEAARELIAALLGAGRPLDVVFTGGGTEADNLGVAGPALADGRRGGVVTSAIEHEAVLDTAAHLERLGCPVAVVGVSSFGRVDPAEVAAAVDDRSAVVSVMTANNELGTLQPLADIASAVHDRSPGVVVHTDAVQAAVSEDVSIPATGVDLLSLAAHKFGGPQGVGALYVRDGIVLEPVLHGGGQELGRRSGTLNVAGIVGMAAAFEAAVKDRDEFRHNVGAARDRFEDELRRRFPDISVNGDVHHRLVQHSHLRLPGVPAETLLIRLDQAGIAAAAGSSCHSGAVEPSHVLTAIGMSPAAAAECVRFTFGRGHGEDDGAIAAASVAAVVEELR